ncbi:LacI family DNA-binding transcriptional regulator [Promicromonospora iranensis]|uniref:LacI family transcriptional regulator n=1 Tax=Promicromonospora iranensis TaxID=1105144 RepID=A0ABU2CN98_9MICO|nr:LacI family DNA-binding transcriptional regulator [Promicromonospora iranensis]MDR7382820.1 LacI family transcriptional regulator [Promicromonospora iranensis]
MSDGPVTLSQVAREAGVSLATASRAINGSATRSVREDLRERVLETARRLDYSPDPSAQAMARGRTTALGLVVHDIADPYFSTIAAGVARAAEHEGLIVTLASTEHSPERELAFVELARRQRSRAIILAGGRLAPTSDALEAALKAFRDAGGGVALIGQPVDDLPVVKVANADGAADLARALHGLGYRRFAVLAGPTGHRTAADRTDGFTGALAELDSAPPPDDILTCAFTRDGGYSAMTALIGRSGTSAPSGRAGHLPELVFAVNDVMAVGAMAAVRDAGLSVPDDVAVAGFDDIHTLRDVTPGLTTVRIPLAEVGALATALALGRSGQADARVRGEVVLRESTPERTR